MRDQLVDVLSLRFFTRAWREIDEEAAAERASHEGYDWRPLVLLVTATVFLTLMEYWGQGAVLLRLLRTDFVSETLDISVSREWRDLAGHCWWAAWRVLGFFLLPLVVIKLSRQRIRDQHMKIRGTGKHAWLYVVGYLVVLGLVLVVSDGDAYTKTYPFYQARHPGQIGGCSRSWVDFLVWEAFYIAQFFSLEFFFRGWWLQQSRRAMGSHAIYVMIVPYVMIHFGKPMTETLAAIIAGLFLGTLAMKTRSIWGGFFVHVGVAVSMDVVSLMKSTGLPTTWWPQ